MYNVFCVHAIISLHILGNFIDLIPGELHYLGPIDLSQYFVKSVNITRYTVPPNVDAVKVDIIFSRRVLATFLTTYLPTALLCIVCFSTNHFKPFFFEAIVTVNLTSLLVLTTLYISVSQSLPTTHYVKMIELWLLFTLLIPFVEVIVHTYIESLREDTLKAVNRHGTVKIIRGGQKGKDGGNQVTQVQPQMEVTEAPERRLYGNYVIKNQKQITVVTMLAKFGIPLFFTIFSVTYFVVGVSL